jgi:hypothetical protein
MMTFRAPARPGQVAGVSACFTGSDRSTIFFDFFPTHTPPPLSRPAGRKRGASFGRVWKLRSASRGVSWMGAVVSSMVSFTAAIVARQNSVERNWGLTPIRPWLPDQVRHDTSNAASPFTRISTRIPSGYFLALNTRPNMAVGSPLPPGGAGEGRGGVSGVKNEKNVNPSVTSRRLGGKNNWNLTPIRGSLAT